MKHLDGIRRHLEMQEGLAKKTQLPYVGVCLLVWCLHNYHSQKKMVNGHFFQNTRATMHPLTEAIKLTRVQYFMVLAKKKLQ